MAVGRSFLVGKSCIPDLGSMGNMIFYTYTLENGVTVYSRCL